MHDVRGDGGTGKTFRARCFPSLKSGILRSRQGTNRAADREQQMSEIIRIGGLEVRFLQSKEDTGGSLDVFEMTVQPNARMPVPHYHESWDEVAYGLTGELTFRVADQDVVLSPGQSVFVKRGVVHSFRNDTPEAAMCLCILTPGVLGPSYFREMAVLLASGVPDVAKMKETMLRYGLVPVSPA
jgi:quercetin dioxygenase-like cupin family protein